MKAQVQKLVSLAILGLTSLAPITPTWAGKALTPEVRIGSNQISRYASGSMVGARYSADIRQHIKCSAIAPTTTGCSAQNSTGYIECRSQDPKFQEVVQGMTDSSYVFFVSDLNGICTELVIYHGSDLLK